MALLRDEWAVGEAWSNATIVTKKSISKRSELLPYHSRHTAPLQTTPRCLAHALLTATLSTIFHETVSLKQPACASSVIREESASPRLAQESLWSAPKQEEARKLEGNTSTSSS